MTEEGGTAKSAGRELKMKRIACAEQDEGSEAGRVSRLARRRTRGMAERDLSF